MKLDGIGKGAIATIAVIVTVNVVWMVLATWLIVEVIRWIQRH